MAERASGPRYGILVGLVILLGILLAIGGLGGQGGNGRQEQQRSSRELSLTQQQRREFASLIEGMGFNCPMAKLAFSEGEDAFGTAMKVYCGPADREGVYEKAVFRVTARPNGSWIVAPFGE